MKLIRFPRLTAAALAATLFGSGCYGQFALTRKVYAWNGQATNNKFANSAILWGLMIIPVYPVAGLIDFLVINTIEVFSGSNPVALNDGSLQVDRDGSRYVFQQIDDNAVRVLVNGNPAIEYRKHGDRLVVTSVQGVVLRTLPASSTQRLAKAPQRPATY